MIERMLLGVIGILLLSVTGVGVTAAVEHPDEAAALVPEAVEVVEEAVTDAVKAVAQATATTFHAVDASLDGPSASEQMTQAEAESVIEASIGSSDIQRGDDDEECDEDEDDAEGDDEDDDECVRALPSSGPVPSPNPQNTPSSQAKPAPAIKTFTMADVAAHNSAASCYAAISGSVYDLTSFIGRHPGGSAAIKSLCGVDGTAAFTGQHGGASRPASELAALKIGTLAQ